MNCHFSRLTAAASLSGLLSFFCVSVGAADQTLIEGDRVSISAADVKADAERMPPDVRDRVLSQPQVVTQIANNLYARRAMANVAEIEGLAKDPAVIAALQVARDKVLSDAYLARLDEKNMPADAVVEELARHAYQAKPERFKAPEQIRVRHILIGASETDGQAQAEKLLAELKAGADFAKVAKERSADPGSASKGGDLGSFARGQMVPEFERAAFALKKPNDLSDVVKTQFGYHILQLVAIEPQRSLSYDEVRPELLQEIRSRAVQDFRAAEAQRLQQGAKVNVDAIRTFSGAYKP